MVRSIDGWWIETSGGCPSSPVSVLNTRIVATARGDEADGGLHLRVGQDRRVDAGGLEDPQHLVVDHGGPRKVVRLLRLLDRDRPHAEVAEQQGKELSDRPEPADQYIAVVHQTGLAVELMRLVSVPMPSISSSTVWPGWIQRSSSSPQQPGIVPVEITSPASSFSPADA